MKYQRPRKWKPRKDAECCVECAKPFKRGDMVFEDVAINIHETCLEDYGRTLRELGLQ